MEMALPSLQASHRLTTVDADQYASWPVESGREMPHDAFEFDPGGNHS
jgi:hypothetical protein